MRPQVPSNRTGASPFLALIDVHNKYADVSPELHLPMFIYASFARCIVRPQNLATLMFAAQKTVIHLLMPQAVYLIQGVHLIRL